MARCITPIHILKPKMGRSTSDGFVLSKKIQENKNDQLLVRPQLKKKFPYQTDKIKHELLYDARILEENKELLNKIVGKCDICKCEILSIGCNFDPTYHFVHDFICENCSKKVIFGHWYFDSEAKKYIKHKRPVTYCDYCQTYCHF